MAASWAWLVNVPPAEKLASVLRRSPLVLLATALACGDQQTPTAPSGDSPTGFLAASGPKSVTTLAPSGDETGATDAANLQAALDNAGKGDVIELLAGTFYLSQLIEVTGFEGTLRGKSRKRTTITTVGDPETGKLRCPTLLDALVTFRGGDVQLESLSFDITETTPCDGPWSFGHHVAVIVLVTSGKAPDCQTTANSSVKDVSFRAIGSRNPNVGTNLVIAPELPTREAQPLPCTLGGRHVVANSSFKGGAQGIGVGLNNGQAVIEQNVIEVSPFGIATNNRSSEIRIISNSIARGPESLITVGIQINDARCMRPGLPSDDPPGCIGMGIGPDQFPLGWEIHGMPSHYQIWENDIRTDRGIMVANSESGTISGNTIDFSDYGIALWGSSDWTVEDNNLHGGGIGVSLGWGGTFFTDPDRFSDPRFDGVHAYRQLIPAQNNKVEKNVIGGATVGVHLESYARNNTVEDNAVSGSGVADYQLDGPFTWNLLGVTLSPASGNVVEADQGSVVDLAAASGCTPASCPQVDWDNSGFINDDPINNADDNDNFATLGDLRVVDSDDAHEPNRIEIGDNAEFELNASVQATPLSESTRAILDDLRDRELEWLGPSEDSDRLLGRFSPFMDARMFGLDTERR